MDIRKSFILHIPTEIRTMRRALAVRLRKWTNLKTIIGAIVDAHPTLATSAPCFRRDDHINQVAKLLLNFGLYTVCIASTNG